MARIRRVVRTLLAAVQQSDASLSLSFVRDPEIRTINRDHRGKDAPTDVLSFPLSPEIESADIERMLGDIVISLDTATRQAADYDAPLIDEVERLLIHGVLHLLGHDHELADERAIMEAEERRLAAQIGLPWPYLDHAPMTATPPTVAVPGT